MTTLANLVKKALRRTGWAVCRARTIDQLEELNRDQILLAGTSASEMMRLLELGKDSKSQFGQDLFVAWALRFKQGGYFVEVGATDGINLSNTYMLEKALGWTGILVEPARRWHAALGQARTCVIDTRCAWTTSGERLLFCEAPVAEMSTIRAFKDGDYLAQSRQGSAEYEVQTVSLTDLLAHHRVGPAFDYLSLDTEGSELQVLDGLDFQRFRPAIITCEHNHTNQRSKIYEWLRSRGYRRVLPGFSKFDDWFVDESAPGVR